MPWSRRRVLLPIVSTAFFYAVCYAIGVLIFDVAVVPAAIPRDYALNLLLAYAIFELSNRAWVFLLVQGLLMALLYIGNAVKISYFGGPIMPDDVYALRALLLLLEGWQFYLAALPLVILLSLLIFNFSLRRRRASGKVQVGRCKWEGARCSAPGAASSTRGRAGMPWQQAGVCRIWTSQALAHACLQLRGAAPFL